jgi:hypothetical protein
VRKPVDGSTEAERLALLNGEAYLTSIVDQMALFGFRDPKNDRQLTDRFRAVAVDLRSPDKVAPVLTPGVVLSGVVSPDGRFLAYSGDETGRPEVYVRDFPALSGRWQVSTAGGEEPRWSADGRELFYRYNDLFMGVRVDTHRAFQASAPLLLFKGVYAIRPVTMDTFSVDPTADRFLMIRPASEGTDTARLRIVVNWFAELERRVPGS